MTPDGAQALPAEAMVLAAARALCRQSSLVCGTDEGDLWRFHCDDFKEDARLALSAALAAAPPADRFFMDHGMWHDRQTGQHLYTEDQYRQGRRDALQEHADRLREAELRTAPLYATPPVAAAPAPVPVLTDWHIMQIAVRADLISCIDDAYLERMDWVEPVARFARAILATKAAAPQEKPE